MPPLRIGLGGADRPPSIRFPDVSIYCRPYPETGHPKLIGDPGIVFVEPETERIRIARRNVPEGWTDDWLAKDEDLALPTLSITLPHAEIFAQD